MKQDIDILILGSGLGGLVCGAMLSREGFKVCIVEKNKQIGGCLQTFVRDKIIFDSGVHYIGGLEKGQNLYQIFKYLGIIDKLKLERLDKNAFDKILFQRDEKTYAMAQGYDNFVEQLAKDFPEEKTAIQDYCNAIKEVCADFPYYNLRPGTSGNEKDQWLTQNAKAFIESVTSNRRLQSVLAGNNFLYAGLPDKTPLYILALILNSYIESSWRCIDGGSQIAKQLAKVIRDNGGDIIRNSKVVTLKEIDGNIRHAVLEDGTIIKSKQFISNIHPSKTLEMTDSTTLRNVYRKRIAGLENSISSFTVSIVFKKNAFPYFKSNFYYFKDDCVWKGIEYHEDEWPNTYGLFPSASGGNSEYASSASLLTYMRYDEVKQWEDSFNTVSTRNERGETYDAFKKRKAAQLIELVEEKFPGFKDSIKTYYTATPLSYRDYIGTNDGAMYGIVKDCNDPLTSFLSNRTKIPNLYLTGQNMALHGILGVTINALVTCGYFVDMDSIIEKIKHA